MVVARLGSVLAVVAVLMAGFAGGCSDFEGEAKATAAAKAAAGDSGGSLGDSAAGAGSEVAAADTDTVGEDVPVDAAADVPPDVASEVDAVADVPPACTPTQCDDGNPCTDDVCTDGNCAHSPNTAGCDDKDACTEADKCAAGKCAGGPAKKCDDTNPCTDDGCDKLKGCISSANTGPCSDDNACTEGDKCDKGSCVAGATKACDDNNPCTLDNCGAKSGCSNSPNAGAPCDDGDKCTTGEKCDSGGACKGSALTCDDKNPCTDDGCDKAKGCVNADNKAACDDGNKCTADDTCAAGVCKGGPAINCDDKEVCTNDACLATVGCDYTNVVGPCSDGDKCTDGDACGNGKCKPGAAPNCDDGKQCTDDGCDKAVGCTNVNNTKGCVDTDLCTQNETCKDGTCGGVPVVCNDVNPCTSDSCDKAKGCVTAPDNESGACNDGNDCTTGDKCTAGTCKGAGKSCDDGNPCTSDTCANNVCSNTNSTGTACTDSNVCTVGDACSAGKCVPGPQQACNDNIPCTDDSCDKVKGCVATPNTAECNDGDACTTNDACAAGACKGGAAAKCDDNNACTTDSCDKTKGCQNANAADGTACTDNNACTTTDKCTAGKCGGTAVVCNDTNPCTADTCDKALGCKATNDDTLTCTDDDVCTQGDKCAAGACKPGVLKNCDDGNACTTDSCDKIKGCQIAAFVGPCDDSNGCTSGDSCVNSACKAGTAKVCDDKDGCTIDSCDAASGLCKTAPAPHVGSEGSAPDGVDNDCEGGTDEEFDLDHDGEYCKGAKCGANEADTCPTVWNPGNDKAACAALGSGWSGSVAVGLGVASASGTAPERRTHEVVEVPLVNGYLDASVLGYWPLDNAAATDKGPAGNNLTLGATVNKVAGAWADSNGAASVSLNRVGSVDMGAAAPSPGAARSIMAWVKVASYPGSYSVVAGWGSGKSFTLYVKSDKWGVFGGASAIDVKAEVDALPKGEWHHVAATYAAGQLAYYVDGKLAASAAKAEIAVDTQFSIGAWSGDGDKLDGSVDDVVAFSRALSPGEIAAYVASKKPYASVLVPGAEADWDDLRVTEGTPYQANHSSHSEVVGVAPHSDSDLKDVLGYWRFNGDGQDLGPDKLHGVVSGGAVPVTGRFGDASGAMRFPYGAQYTMPTKAKGSALNLKAGSLEMWFRIDACGKNIVLLNAHKGGVSDYGAWLAVSPECNIALAPQGSPEIDIVSTSKVVPKRWTHVGISWDGATGVIYLDGAQDGKVATPYPVNFAGMDMWVGNFYDSGPQPFEIDEVLIHSVAKPADYFAKRARPGLPTLRFLASTKPYATAGAFDFYKYAVRTGNSTAPALPPALKALDKTTTCNALLSPCLGYTGWWRFDEGFGKVALDSSSSAVHGTANGTPTWSAGAAGIGMAFGAGATSSVSLLFPSWKVGDATTVEYAAKPTSSSSDGSVISNDNKGVFNAMWKFSNFKFKFYAEQFDVFPLQTNEVQCSTGNWCYQGFVGVLGTKQMGFFANGTSVASSLSGSATGGPSTSSPIALTFGNRPVGDDGMTGVLDNIRLMSRALTPDELLHYPVATATLAASSADPCATKSCDDGNPCTTDTCTNGTCSNVSVTDGTDCGGGKVCGAGTCKVPAGVIGSWTATTPLPAPTGSLFATAANGYLYAISGQTSGAPQSGKVYYAPIASDGKVGTWQATSSFSPARNAFSIAVDAGYLYVLPGSLGGSQSTTNVSVAQLLPAGGAAAFAATKELPAYADMAGSVATGGYVVITGGAFASYFAAVWTGAIDSDHSISAWKTTTSLPAARGQHRAFAYGGYVFVAGGYASGAVFQEVLAAPLQAGGTLGTWSATQPLPTKRSGFGHVSNGAVQLVLGGYDASGNATAETASTSALAGGKTDPWKAQTSLPYPAAGCGAAYWNGRVYAVGGVNATGLLNAVSFAPAP
ncbi:MAG: hypothetical protein FJ100_11945 [Deltaproteobacteria bacterium]|nr:hypothetical protein [Deltaproteobacteria bacterium]